MPQPERHAFADDPPAVPRDENAEIARLAGLPTLDYERERESAAQRLGCRVLALDHLVSAARDHGSNGSGQGRPLVLPDPEAWPKPVDGAALLDALTAAVRRHVVLRPAEADAVALWVLGSHAMAVWTIYPRLLVTAPEKGCGKSTLLDVLGRLVPRPLAASNITAPALFRTIEAARPTLLLDEADTYARDNEDLRGVIDAGHRRDGAAIRLVGDDHEPRQFSCWAAMALAAIGRLPGTVEDRSIIIRLARRRSDEPVEALRGDRDDGMLVLARQAARWISDHTAALRDADPEMPAGIVNRAADNWRPLLALADAAGGGWPSRSRASSSALALDGAGDAETTRTMLLADIRATFDAKATNRLSSDELVAHLTGLDDRPWPELRGGKPLTKAGLARLLHPFGILSGSIRLDDGRTPKGYYRRAFDDAFARYLPPPPYQNATTPQPAETMTIPPIPKRHNGFNEEDLWRFENPKNLSNPAACGVVAFSDPPAGEEDVPLPEAECAEWTA